MTTDLEAFAAWLQAPDLLPDGHLAEPPDGSIILVDESAAYVRTDTLDAQRRAERFEPGAWVGDWWLLDGTDNNGPQMLAEILNDVDHAVDDPDLRVRTFEVLYDATDVARLAKTFTGPNDKEH